MILNEVDCDFIEFMSIRKAVPAGVIEKAYIETKRRFDFASLSYRELAVSIHLLHRVAHDDTSEQELIAAYKFHELLRLYRFISYSYPKPKLLPRLLDYGKVLIQSIIAGDFVKIKRFAEAAVERKQLSFGSTLDCKQLAHELLTLAPESPVVVDYGCGLGYLSFEMARTGRVSKVYLLDIDCMTLEFACFRFRKHGLQAEVIAVKQGNTYPELPEHQLCIATEVMEHVPQPLLVYHNINKQMSPGGILYGDFGDHRPEMFHVSTRLAGLREELLRSYKHIGPLAYQRL